MSIADADNLPRPLFPRLPSGRGKMSPEQIARHQKGRLQGAMVEAVARKGFENTTLHELVTLAAVSKSTFYRHFSSKEDCFLSTFDEIIEQVSARVGAAYRRPGDFRERLVAGLDTFARLVVDEPAAASLVAVESLALGVEGVEHRERAAQRFELLIQQSFDRSPSRQQVPAITVRAIVAGIHGVVYRHLRDGRVTELPGRVEELADWTLRYQRPESESVRAAVRASERPVPPSPPGSQPGVDWQEPPASQLSREHLDQRQRIVRGVAQVVVECGYRNLSTREISAAAGISNQTFYEQFDSKREAFLAAFEQLAAEAFAMTSAAVAASGERTEAIGAGLRALLEHVTANELFARLAFFELPTAGPDALDRADALLDSFGTLLAPDVNGLPLSPTLLEAIPSGVWATLQHEIHAGRLEALPEMAPEIVRIVLVSGSSSG